MADTRLLDLATSVPWLMTEDALASLLSICARENLSPELVEAELGRPLDNTQRASVRDGVATIPIEGPIVRRANLFTRISGGTSTGVLALDLETALSDPTVHSILLAIDSPGGEANGIAELATMVYAARGRKPIVAYISGLGASAAYWIASAASEVVVDSLACVGSIGAVVAVRDPERARSGVIEFVSSQSPHKRADPTTRAGKTQLQTLVDSLGAVFVDAVARHRGVDTQTVLDHYGQGALFVGQQAVDAGLADRLGSYEGVRADLAARRGYRALPSRAGAVVPVAAAVAAGQGSDRSTALRYTARDKSTISRASAAAQGRAREGTMGNIWNTIFRAAKEEGIDLADQAAVSAEMAALQPLVPVQVVAGYTANGTTVAQGLAYPAGAVPLQQFSTSEYVDTGANVRVTYLDAAGRPVTMAGASPVAERTSAMADEKKDQTEETIAGLTARLDAAEAARTAAEAKADAAQQKAEATAALVADMQAASRHNALVAEAKAGGWIGASPEEHATFMEALPTPDAQTFYRQQQRGAAAIARDSALYAPQGKTGGIVSETAMAEMHNRATALAADGTVSYPDAITQVTNADPGLAARYHAERRTVR